MRSGIKIIEEIVGAGDTIKKLSIYRMSLRFWLNRGDPILWKSGDGSQGDHTLIGEYKIERRSFFAGLLYGIEGMRVGGMRLLKISPHLAYREKGVEGIVPSNATLKVEVIIFEEVNIP